MPTSNKKTVLVDTSTLFSGLGWAGVPSDVLLVLYSRDGYFLRLSDRILQELFRNVKKFPDDRQPAALQSLEYLQKAAIVTEDRWREHLTRAKQEVTELKDAPILTAYFLEDTDYLVTSNAQDFPVDQYETIVSPNEFLDLLND
jgi:predicted nucleic acid-binding protein